jgi:hypothetical protein
MLRQIQSCDFKNPRSEAKIDLDNPGPQTVWGRTAVVRLNKFTVEAHVADGSNCQYSEDNTKIWKTL